MTYTYKTQGTCSSNIELDVEDGIVKEVAFWGGWKPARTFTFGERHAGRCGDCSFGRNSLRKTFHFLPRPIVQGIARDGVLSLLPERMDESP